MQSIQKRRDSQTAFFLRFTAIVSVAWVTGSIEAAADDRAGSIGERNAKSVAAAVDQLILKELQKEQANVAERTSDEDFLRRVTFDLAGTVPSPREVTLFGLDPDSRKRSKLIDRLLNSDDYAQNWTRYWRDVIFLRATEMRARLGQRSFETWMLDQFKQDVGWDEVATALITATGDVREAGETALIFAQGGQAPEIASETSRIFLGIQIQCANCHDHPTDQWKRQQFHELAAFFPRTRVRPKRNGTTRSFEVVSFDASATRRRGDIRQNPEQIMRRLDKNKDGKLTKKEVEGTPLARPFDRILERGDTNNDKAISVAEFKKLPAPMMRNRATPEYRMPDLTDPASEGKRIDPVFFVGELKPKKEMKDMDRRETLSRYLTSSKNPWFAKAYVNRIWAEMLGVGFYMPIDDMGPQRSAMFPEALELLADGFVANSYNMKWLFRTIANTQTYQRNIRARTAGDTSLPFASATPTRLRADQLFSALTKVLGVRETDQATTGRGAGGPYRGDRSGRGQFNRLFGFDPSTPQEDITGSVPQALFMMNSPIIHRLVSANGDTRLSRTLNKFTNDEDAVNEMYLLVLAREPSAKEIKICLGYIKKVGKRKEAFEDLMWSLINSSEFLSKR